MIVPIRRRILPLIAVITASAIVLFSCNPSGIGIFYSIEIEESIEDSPVLGNEITPLSVASFNDTYYVAVKTLYSSPDAEEWKLVDISTLAYPNVQQLLVFNGFLYGIFYAEGDTKTEADPDMALMRSSDGASFTDVGDVEGEPEFLFVENGTLFVCLRSGSTYSLAYSSDGIAFTPDALTDLYQPVFDSCYDGSLYWFITESSVFTGASPSSLAAMSSLPSRHLGGILYSHTNDAVFLSGSVSGQIYWYGNDSWTASAVTETTSKTEIEFLDMYEFTIDGGTYLLVGTRDNGYYETLLTGTPLDASFVLEEPSGTTNDNYYNVGLSSYSIRCFFPLDADSCFALTLGKGLWINRVEDEERTWSRS